MRFSQFFARLKSRLKNYARSVFVIIAFGFILSLIGNITAIKKAEDRIAVAQSRVDKLKKEKRELEEKLAVVENDFYIESQLRNSLGLAKENEIVLVMPDEETLRKLAPKITTEEEKLPDPNWKKWLKLFL